MEQSLVLCASVSERNLLADTAKIVEKNKRKDDNCRSIVTDGLLALGYDASICKSHWEKSPSYPAGTFSLFLIIQYKTYLILRKCRNEMEFILSYPQPNEKLIYMFILLVTGAYEYIDVIIQGERLIIDIDFRSEFEIARSTKTYKSILQTLPYIFVGKADRLQKIISIISEAAKQSLKKKGMHIPPWRKADYIKAKWLSPHPRSHAKIETNQPLGLSEGEFKVSCGENNNNDSNSVDDAELGESMFVLSGSSEEEKKVEVKAGVKDWKPPEVKPNSLQIGARIVTGLASVIEDHQP